MDSEPIAFISCPKGIEPLLLDELKTLGEFSFSKQHIGGLTGTANIPTLYRICLWSRLSNRVLLLLADHKVRNKTDLREWLLSVPWSTHMSTEHSFMIRFFGELPGIQHTQYGAQFTKDAIVDFFRDRHGTRPTVNREQPDVRFQINIDKQHARLYLDLSGNSLHQRGYRRGIGAAPLKENLAAALLLRAQWPKIAARGGALIDPLCGSGTLLTEAALMAANIAPGLYRTNFGFTRWLQHEPNAWQDELEKAQTVIRNAIPPILGYDMDARALGVARQHIANLKLDHNNPRVYKKLLADWKLPSHIDLKPGLLITNPPYGERISNKSILLDLYKTLGEKCVKEMPDWQAAIFTADPQLAKATRTYWSKSFTFYNGNIKCQLYLIEPERGLKPDLSEKLITQNSAIDITPFTNRLQKNRKRLAGWLKQNNIECYRLYFSDIPEFSVAIDMYRDWAVVQEYQAPKTIDPATAANRLQAILQALPSTLKLDPTNIIFKQRRQQKGKAQYEKLNQPAEYIQIREGKTKLLVELNNYLDTGLFLDHRPLRTHLAKISQGKSLLNLFCYTAAASVHAAIGGASKTVSIDLSKTYINWAKKNFELNKLNTQKHKLVQADILTWLNQQQESFDIIFLDPPTFSNSKRMLDTLDIQRDHSTLIKAAMRCLQKTGLLLFSCNYRKFKLDKDIISNLQVKNITDWSIPRDFRRPGKIHHCFEIRHANENM